MKTSSNINDIGGWNSFNILQNNVVLGICIFSALLHTHLWLQIFIQKAKFDLSFIFPIGYMITDPFIITASFIQYSIRIRSWLPVTTFSCYLEAYGTFYFNIIESYCLTALNICRYWQVIRNQNPYKFHRRKIIIGAVLIPLWIVFNLIVQGRLGWCMVTQTRGASCSLTYTNIFVQIWNLVIILIIPIAISFIMLIRVLYYLQHSHAQQVIMRRNHHREIIKHSLIFYSLWLCLWLPIMVMVFIRMNSMPRWIVFAGVVPNILETAADPIIAFFLDKRFAQAYKKCFRCILPRLVAHSNATINPVYIIVPSRETQAVGRRCA